MEISSAPEYCSLSERTVTPDSAIGFVGSSEDIVLLLLGAKSEGCFDSEIDDVDIHRRPEKVH